MDKKTFFDKCKNHDWHFEFSDDGREWRAGVQSRIELLQLQKDNPKLRPIYEAWNYYMFSGKTFGKPEAPKPTYEMFEIKEDK